MTDQTMHLYSLPIELAEPPEGVIVTDVVVLARGVRLDDQSSDTLLVASTDSTAGIVYRGMLAAALPHLTADDLRHTPAGRVLLAEGWDRGAADNERVWIHVYDGHDVDPDDPWAMCLTCNTPNPYREETE